ncbi:MULTISPECIES: Gmad2 immunoglobulin-like domain-containing protein [unclassified Streptomyces]|uniref:Gmad2 immunoglobulin-like domain-containing protein n=1 Tax=unclassified Streptomyces TaxID=2593676 RepID=UPI00035ECB85|nr:MULTISPECIES: Gmad2 immunoglobulin-like domain-containing protein [unclassified Streptomyces]
MDGARLAASRPARALAAALLSLALLSACGGTGREPSGAPSRTGTPVGTPSRTSPDPTSPASAPPPVSAPASASASATAAPRPVRAAVYFLHEGRLSAAPRTVTGPATAAAALRALLAGPSGVERGQDRVTAIPSGTALRSLAVRDRVATVDLSGRYDDAPGASADARLAQVVFTATRFPGVERVRFRVDGGPAAGLGPAAGGRPLGRGDFEDLSPGVLVESPLLGETVTAPLRVHGTANTFEAEFRLRVSDGSGRTVADVRVAASSGSGTRGTFDVTVPYRAAGVPGPGTLTAYVLSAEDGHRVVLDTVPLTLAQ